MTTSTPFPLHVQAVDLAHAYRLINHGPTVLVTSAHQGRHNVMAAAWNMPLDFHPPKVALVIDKSTATRALAVHSGWLALNVPGAGLADATLTVGSVSALSEGAMTGPDKFNRYGLQTWTPPAMPEGPIDDMPRLVQGCVGWLLCRLLPDPALQDAHDLFLAEVTAAWSDTRAFAEGKYRPLGDIPAHLRTLHHLGAGHFVVPGSTVKGQMLDMPTT